MSAESILGLILTSSWFFWFAIGYWAGVNSKGQQHDD